MYRVSKEWPYCLGKEANPQIRRRHIILLKESETRSYAKAQKQNFVFLVSRSHSRPYLCGGHGVKNKHPVGIHSVSDRRDKRWSHSRFASSSGGAVLLRNPSFMFLSPQNLELVLARISKRGNKELTPWTWIYLDTRFHGEWNKPGRRRKIVLAAIAVTRQERCWVSCDNSPYSGLRMGYEVSLPMSNILHYLGYNRTCEGELQSEPHANTSASNIDLSNEFPHCQCLVRQNQFPDNFFVTQCLTRIWYE